MTNDIKLQHYPKLTSAYPEAPTELVADYNPALVSADVLLDQESANDRHNQPSSGNDVLLHSDSGRNGLLRASDGLRASGIYGRREQGGVQAETGQATGKESSSDGRSNSSVNPVSDLLSSCFPTIKPGFVFKPEEHVEAVKKELCRRAFNIELGQLIVIRDLIDSSLADKPSEDIEANLYSARLHISQAIRAAEVEL